jgi:hypothetical protein
MRSLIGASGPRAAGWPRYANWARAGGALGGCADHDLAVGGECLGLHADLFACEERCDLGGDEEPWALSGLRTNRDPAVISNRARHANRRYCGSVPGRRLSVSCSAPSEVKNGVTGPSASSSVTSRTDAPACATPSRTSPTMCPRTNTWLSRSAFANAGRCTGSVAAAATRLATSGPTAPTLRPSTATSRAAADASGYTPRPRSTRLTARTAPR